MNNYINISEPQIEPLNVYNYRVRKYLSGIVSHHNAFVYLFWLCIFFSFFFSTFFFLVHVHINAFVGFTISSSAYNVHTNNVVCPRMWMQPTTYSIVVPLQATTNKETWPLFKTNWCTCYARHPNQEKKQTQQHFFTKTLQTNSSINSDEKKKKTENFWTCRHSLQCCFFLFTNLLIHFHVEDNWKKRRPRIRRTRRAEYIPKQNTQNT